MRRKTEKASWLPFSMLSSIHFSRILRRGGRSGGWRVGRGGARRRGGKQAPGSTQHADGRDRHALAHHLRLDQPLPTLPLAFLSESKSCTAGGRWGGGKTGRRARRHRQRWQPGSAAAGAELQPIVCKMPPRTLHTVSKLSSEGGLRRSVPGAAAPPPEAWEAMAAPAALRGSQRFCLRPDAALHHLPQQAGGWGRVRVALGVSLGAGSAMAEQCTSVRRCCKRSITPGASQVCGGAPPRHRHAVAITAP